MNGHLFKLRQEDLSAMAVFESVLTLNMVTHTHTLYIYIYIYNYHHHSEYMITTFLDGIGSKLSDFTASGSRLFGGSSKFRRVDLRSLGLRGPAV